jgi:hypothetical protein
MLKIDSTIVVAQQPGRSRKACIKQSRKNKNNTIMSKTDKSYLLKFEVLSESKGGNLVNGFSGAIGMSEINVLGGEATNYIWCPTNNNCAGANCVAGCGEKKDPLYVCSLG